MGALRRPLRLAVLLACMLALPAASAEAVTEPPQIVAGANSKWISGDLLQQTGLNCSTAILGSSYTEVMVSGSASYGGAPNGGVPKVGDPYWTAFLVAIPGNPCGSGSSSVVTTVILPPHTQVDSSRQIKCYGLPRSATSTTPWQDLTNASWSFLGQSGPYCASQPSISPYHPGGLQIGFRPLANGQFFWIFVPVKSSAELKGAAAPSPGDGFTWLTDATGVYANPGRSFVWTNVLPNLGSNPFIFFSREPAAIPFWNSAAPDGLKNQVEFFADLYSAFKPGTLCFELYAGATATGSPLPNTHCSQVSGWDGTVTNAADLWQVFGNGPNKGYVPFAYADNTVYTLKWTFTYTGGSTSKTATFTTLAGPDQDGDGVANNGTDACPNVKGTLPNGCLPAVQDDPDRDGVYGAADRCPSQDGQGALNGCLGGIIPQIDPPKPDPVPVLGGILDLKKGALFKKAALAKGARVKLQCTVNSAAKGTLTIAAKVAKALRIKLKRKQKKVVIAKGAGNCVAGSGGTLKLKVVRAHAKKVKRARKKFPAALAIGLTAPNQTPVTLKQSVKFG